MFDYDMDSKNLEEVLVEIDEKKLQKIIEFSATENLLIIGKSQKGKTNILKKL